MNYLLKKRYAIRMGNNFRGALLHGYDNRLINNLDNYPLYVLDHGGGYNYFTLKANNVSVRNTAYVGL